MSGSMPELSLKERVLLWLVVVAEEGDEGSLAPTQAGIAQVTGLSRGHVSRTVAPLIADGFLREGRVRVTGFSRVLKAYSVTAKGRAEYARLRSALLAAPVSVRGADGTEERRLGELIEGSGAAALWHALQALQTVGYLEEATAGGVRPALGRARFQVDDAEAPPRARFFVGREAEVESVRSWLANDRGLLVVEAPGGLGKSTLVAEALAPGAGNRHVLWVRISPAVSPQRLVERLARFLREVGRALPPPPEVDSVGLPDHLQRALKGVPLLVVVDDVQKAAQSTSHLLGVLVRLAQRLPTFRLVLLGRSVALPGERVAADARLRLEPLSPSAAQHVLELRGVPRAERAGIAHAAQGVPIFLDLLAERARAVGLPGAAAGREVAYERVVADLAAGMAPTHLELASWAAAIRTPFPGSLFQRVGVGSETALHELTAAGLLMRRADGRLEMHDLVRESFYPRLGQRERQRIHARLAEAFRPAQDWHRGEDGDAQSAQVTEFLHHLVVAGRREEAVRWVMRNQSRIVEAARRLFQEGVPTTRQASWEKRAEE